MYKGQHPHASCKDVTHPTSPYACSVCSILQLPDCLTEGRGWVGKCLEDAGGCCPFYITDKYSLARMDWIGLERDQVENMLLLLKLDKNKLSISKLCGIREKRRNRFQFSL